MPRYLICTFSHNLLPSEMAERVSSLMRIYWCQLHGAAAVCVHRDQTVTYFAVALIFPYTMFDVKYI